MNRNSESLNGPNPSGQLLFEQIVAAYQPKIYKYIQRLVSDPELSSDLVQETFLGIYFYQARQETSGEGFNLQDFLKSLQPLIYRIARNKALDELRRRKNHPLVSFNPAAHFDPSQEEFDPAIEYMLTGPGSSLENQYIMSEELKNAVAQIGRRRLLNFFLHLDGYSYKEIGQITGDNMANVKSKIFRSKQSLRQALSGIN